MARRDFTTSTNTTMVNIITKQPVSMSSKEIFGERIRYYRKRAGFLQPALADALGVSKNTISNWEAGRARPDLDNIVQMCRVLKITPSQLFGTEHAITLQDRSLVRKYHQLNGTNRKIVESLIDQLISAQEIAQQECPDLILIPKEIKPLAAGIGDPAEFYEDDKEILYVHADAINRHVDYVFLVNGESMEPDFYDGDMVMVQIIAPGDLLPGEIGAFQIGNELYIKEYRDEGLYSHNPIFSPIYFNEFTGVYLIGKVIGKLEKSDLATKEEIDLYNSFVSANH